MRKSCAVCGTPFESKRPNGKFCGARCRQRAHRRPEAASEAEVLALPAEPTSESASGAVAAATSAELERAGRWDTALGQAALALARRLDSASGETGSSLAAVARQHRETLAEATKDAQTAADPLDELRLRRERKLSGS